MLGVWEGGLSIVSLSFAHSPALWRLDARSGVPSRCVNGHCYLQGVKTKCPKSEEFFWIMTQFIQKNDCEWSLVVRRRRILAKFWTFGIIQAPPAAETLSSSLGNVPLRILSSRSIHKHPLDHLNLKGSPFTVWPSVPGTPDRASSLETPLLFPNCFQSWKQCFQTVSNCFQSHFGNSEIVSRL